MRLSRQLLTIIFTAVALCATASRTQADTIDFESLTPMPNSPGTLVPAEARLSGQLLGSGVSFSSGSDFVAVVSLGAGHATSGFNGIGGVTVGGALSYSTPVTITFSLPSDSSVQAVTDFVSIRGDRIPIAGSVTLEAFDINGNSLGGDTKPDGVGATLSFSAAGIHSIRISQSSGTVALDDLSFDTPTSAVTTDPIPEPATLLLFGTGLAGLGRVIKRKRQDRKE